MAKKPRNKKYNPKKLDKWATRVAERGTMLIQAQGLGKEGKVWVFHNKPVPSGEWLAPHRLTDYRLTFLTPHKWTVVAGVACRNQLGQNYFTYTQQSANNEFIYHDPQIQQWIYEFVAEQINDVNKEHILSSFFIALPYQTELAESDIDKLLHWLNIFDPNNIKTHYEMLQIKAEAESVIKDIPLEDFVPKQTACTLRKHNIPDLMTLFWQEEERLKQLKGIGEKRYQHICEGLKSLAKKHPSLRELAWDSHRGDMCREFILADAANSEKIYQHYLESKKK
ncbi:hypothetical protein [Mannheimia varigena]|uniref:hypothetical protein n=1 Tax=Mannheimia varigena TaxID=85404 RepID=UPI0015B479F1|nr:hypothetical protein [Mannheimia varigena]QLD33207.1 hypothetical protein A6B42_05250 [Mannheimia varigena]